MGRSTKVFLVLSLCAIIALTTLPCASAFNFVLFSNNNEREKVYLHPSSPKEVDPQSSHFRAKRQAYQLAIGNVVSITADKNVAIETGTWGPWSQKQDCSRSCGGGVLVEKRQCNGECTGPSVRYVSCNLDDCVVKTNFRAIQCAKHNDSPLDGNYFKWVPYPGKNKCELTCKPDTANFYYKWADKVVDGTRCGDNLADATCVDGVCLPLGCDGRLGSVAKKDKCGVCNGNETTCKSVDGFFDERTLTPGYHDILVLPIGATGIKVVEIRPTSNSLAIKNSTGHFYLNGNYQIHLLDKDVIIAGGAAFDYNKAKPEASLTENLSAIGPLEEELTISLLYQPGSGSKNGAIKYEYSVPLEDDSPYYYKPGEWSSCSVTCGKGVQTRTPYCIDKLTQQRVDDQLCISNNATKPEFEKSCATIDCDAQWFVGDWEECSHSCGERGSQYRIVYCHKVFMDGRRITVLDGNCTSVVERPIVKQTCNRFSCPEWHAGPWSACSEKCGDAKQYRSVTCLSEKENEEGRLLPADACPTDIKLESERDCNLGPCEGLAFYFTEWNFCERCNDTEETRNVTCKDSSGRSFPLEKCLNDTISEIPIDSRACATQPPCIYEWHTSQYSKCSTDCGHGHKSRKVYCAINEIGDFNIVGEYHCSDTEKPVSEEDCVNEAKCTGTYFNGPWSNCSETCNGGNQSRIVVCLNYDHKPVPELCDESTKPPESQSCNVDPCPTCHTSEFGCCSDNSTYALGEFLQGCSNCSISEFGCCTDNVTTALGPNGKGCLEYVEPEESSGESDETTATVIPDENSKCQVKNEKTGEEISVLCSFTIPPILINETENLLLNNLTSENGTDIENITKNCLITEFGCCPDWYTSAEGKNLQGCPEYVLGLCNNTKYGCCLDNITLSRGTNFEGCGESTCAASLYGCCKDRKTIAFGSHYAGCQRSSFPCELSSFGCCPDGETAALDKNLTGCSESCLLTKFGCCPDGKTHALGINNKGCGCEYAQYGCCPDGKLSAKGAGYYGCPETCAQSQHGCCPDGKTSARGPNKEGCPCQYTRWGCCPDGETTSLGPRNKGCDNCRYTKHGCCPDGESKAIGPNYAGCPTTTSAPYILGGTVSPRKILACNLPQDQGSVCQPGYKLVWFYDTTEGRCSQFWFGGCGGNDNNFVTKEQCEQICVEPPELGRCYLPKIDGPQRCSQLAARYYYDYTTKQCAAFWWRGCLGNSNNFASWEECQNHCSSVGPLDVISNERSSSYSPYGPPPNTPVFTPAPQLYSSYSSLPGHPQPRYSVVQNVEQSVDSELDYQQRLVERQRLEKKQADEHRLLEEERLALYQKQLEEHKRLEQLRRQQFESQNQPTTIRSNNIKDDASCYLTVNSGNCSKYQTLWYFDSFYGQCYNFVYSGCGGNTNRYSTQSECEQKCGHLKSNDIGKTKNEQNKPQHSTALPISTANFQTTLHTTLSSLGRKRFRTTTKSREICNLRLDVGRCEGHFDKWYYEVATGNCEQFQYSGCGGNANRFHTKDQCENLCLRDSVLGGHTGLSNFVPSLAEPQSLSLISSVNHNINQFIHNAKKAVNIRSVCDALKDTGTCSRFVTKWYYNKADGTCNRFHYSGCDGNGNRFETEQDCKNTCGNFVDACFLPKVVGTCAGKNERWYFDQAFKKCVKFEYSGCLGNTNNFRNMQECEARCFPIAPPLSSSQKTIVQLENDVNGSVTLTFASQSNLKACNYDPKVGPCRATIEMYYYNRIQDKCLVFYYGGCFGNLNRFNTFEECMQMCASPERLTDLSNIDHLGEVFRHKRLPRQQKMSVVYPIPNSSHYMIKESLTDDVVTDSFLLNTLNYAAVENTPENESIDDGFQNFEEKLITKYPENFDLLPELCTLPVERGSCFGDYLLWHYDAEISKCTPFRYSGCQANPNSFTSVEACERACGAYRNVAVCKTSYDAGNCLLSENPSKAWNESNDGVLIAKWFYDQQLGQCHTFMWTGCGGNGNRFTSQADCENLCRRETANISQAINVINRDIVCLLERDSGPCTDSVTQWYFNRDESECRKFTYGGCRGNRNRFNSKALCDDRCRIMSSNDLKNENKTEENVGQLSIFQSETSTIPTSRKKFEKLSFDGLKPEQICNLPFEKGPCSDEESLVYYFDSLSATCRLFTYGGCGGNVNRFETEIECLEKCKSLALNNNGTGYNPGTNNNGIHIEASQPSPYLMGQSVDLKCLQFQSKDDLNIVDYRKTPSSQETTWYLNDMELNIVSNDSGESHKMFVNEKQILRISKIQDSDAGNYSCAIGANGMLSSTFTVNVQETLPYNNCYDRGAPTICGLVKRTGLCANARYGKFCCVTCKT